jgi:hypothetical protein
MTDHGSKLEHHVSEIETHTPADHGEAGDRRPAPRACLQFVERLERHSCDRTAERRASVVIVSLRVNSRGGAWERGQHPITIW